jgi:hypothetical protein
VVFHENTAFVREFEPVPEDLIFQDRGQVEVTNLLAPDPLKGHLKISVHSPFKPLKSGETLEHRETWRLLEYDPEREEDVPFTPRRERDQMLIFLNQHNLAKPHPLRAPEPEAEFGPYGNDSE